MNTPIKIMSKSISIIATSAIVTLGSGSNLSAAAFTETFDNPTVSNQAANYIGWNTYATPSATDESASNVKMYVATGDDASIRLADNNATLTGPNLLTYVDTIVNGVSSITFDSREILYSGSDSFTLRLAVQTESDGWVASSDTFTLGSTTANFSYTFSTDAAKWLDLTINPGTALSIGSVIGSDLASANIQSIGFYISGNPDNYNGIVKLDNLVVVPEASSYALILGAVGLLMIGAKRRAKYI